MGKRHTEYELHTVQSTDKQVSSVQKVCKAGVVVLHMAHLQAHLVVQKGRAVVVQKGRAVAVQKGRAVAVQKGRAVAVKEARLAVRNL